MLGKSKEYASPWFQLEEGEKRERFRARYPTVAEYQAFAAAREAAVSGGDSPGSPSRINGAKLYEGIRRVTMPLLTGYDIEDGETPGNWRELLEADGRYVEVVAAIGLELFRQASFTSANGTEPA